MGQFIAFILFMPLFYLLVTGLFNAAPALTMLLLIISRRGNRRFMRRKPPVHGKETTNSRKETG